NPNILFYSQKCPYSQELIKLLNNENLLNMFQLFCVDNNINKIPQQIKVVPTLIVSNIPKPLPSNEAFEWVKKMRFIRNQNNSMNINNTHNNNSKDRLCFIEQEMSGFSD